MYARYVSTALKKISIDRLQRASVNRPEGYVEDVISRGRIEGDVLFLEDGVYVELTWKYSPPKPAEYDFGPTTATKAVNALGAFGRVARAAVKREQIKVSSEEQSRRMAICHACVGPDGHFNGRTCDLCGCVVNWKTKLATEKCPIGKW